MLAIVYHNIAVWKEKSEPLVPEKLVGVKKSVAVCVKEIVVARSFIVVAGCALRC